MIFLNKYGRINISFSRFPVTGFFVHFEGNSILPKKTTLKTRFFPWNSIFRQIYANFPIKKLDLGQNLHGETIFMAFVLPNVLGKGSISCFLAYSWKFFENIYKETPSQKWWNSYSKWLNSFSERQNSLDLHFLCKDEIEFRTYNPIQQNFRLTKV